MKKLDINRFMEMQTFVTVVEQGGLSAAAKYCRKSPSAMSKLMTRLEARLNTRLINRSTRGLQITEAGRIFYKRSIRVLSELEDAEQSITLEQTPAGHLRISSGIATGRTFLLPLIPAFMQQYPKITLDITFTDKVIDLIEENTDVAIRFGVLKNSTLTARKLAEARMLVVGSPGYLKKHGIPKTPKGLAKHNLIRLNFSRTIKGWPFKKGRKKITIRPKGNIEVSAGEIMHQLTLDGVGLGRMASFMVEQDIEAGRLVEVLGDYHTGEKEALYAVFLGQGSFVPARIRAFIDFLADRIMRV